VPEVTRRVILRRGQDEQGLTLPSVMTGLPKTIERDVNGVLTLFAPAQDWQGKVPVYEAVAELEFLAVEEKP